MGNTTYTESAQGEYDWSNTTPSRAVVDAIAAFENVEPIDLPEALDATLFEYVEPEALDTLVTGDSSVSISFHIGEYLVRIGGTTLVVGYD